MAREDLERSLQVGDQVVHRLTPHMQSQAVTAASQGFSASLVPVQFEKHRRTLEATPGETETEELLIDETAKRGR